MSENFVLVTVKNGTPVSIGSRGTRENLSECAKDANARYNKDGLNHIVVPVGQKGTETATVVTINKKDPTYSSVGQPISKRSAIDASIWSDKNYKKDGYNSFIVGSNCKYFDY